MSRCHHDVDVRACATCRRLDVDVATTDESPSFIARYTSGCARCSSPIEPGQRVRYSADDELVHVRRCS